MKKDKPRSNDALDSVKSVSMQTLDKELSRHVEIARRNPVPIDRYGVPWVWIVSHPLWMEVDYLKSFVPENHPLVALKEVIDSILAYEGVLMNEITLQCRSGMDARMITRAWLLQIAYSLADPKGVCEGLRYNMLWRWFVGYMLRSEPLPELQAFAHDINIASAHPRVIDIVHRCLTSDALLSTDTEEFKINRGLLHALMAHRDDAPRLPPASLRERAPRERDERTLSG
ncbi:hypothetical protein APR50_04440 [Variovorax paradoxus]|jgi:transposase|uniref:transposase n=1 Tax=Variovorax TaxID=34072 RepID=UPI0006E64014|nr:transposase [Variovorax sp. CY25R-8]KPV10984.1 hypothetical protein APR50_04440 [Variovorax paradoxus]KPV36143.1 hypothetical protein APR47_12405 [Variovorax paradoxus]MCT8175728.1 transposase [Variovorax sp. CY25R-8]